MFRKRILAPLAALAITGALAVVIPMVSASAATCTAPAWNASTAYNGGAQVSFGDHQYTAKWWSQGHEPDKYSGEYDEWRDNGPCSGGGGGATTPPPSNGGGGATTPPPSNGGGSGCTHPAWAEGTSYRVGDRVSYNGKAYEAIQAHTAVPGAGWNPASTPTLWKQVGECGGGTTPPTTPPSTTPPPSGTTPPPSGNGGSLPKHELTGYWQNFNNGAATLRLRDVSSNYDLIAAAFADTDPSHGAGAVTFNVDSGLSSALGGYTNADLKADIGALHSRGKKVVISVGGQNGTVAVGDSTAAANFATSVYQLMQNFGFDGVDIDLENGITPQYMSDALHTLRAKAGSGLIITMAPETIFMQSASSTYLGLALRIKDILTVVHTQYYNSGAMNGCDGKVYGQGTVDFIAAQACIALQAGLRPDQVAIGLPASSRAAGGGYVDPSVVNNALDCLATVTHCGSFKPSQTWPGIRGAMTWSISWDKSAGSNWSGSVKAHLNTLP